MTDEQWAALTEEEFRTMTKESAMNRIRYPQWRRNLRKTNFS
jgi:epoxyqueuosine reductase QueG